MGGVNSGYYHKYPTMKEFSEIVNLSEVTLWKYVKELRDMLEITNSKGKTI